MHLKSACNLQTLHRKAIATFCEQINKVTIGTYPFSEPWLHLPLHQVSQQQG